MIKHTCPSHYQNLNVHNLPEFNYRSIAMVTEASGCHGQKPGPQIDTVKNSAKTVGLKYSTFPSFLFSESHLKAVVRTKVQMGEITL